MAEYLRKGCGDLIEVASDNDDVKDDDDDANSKDVEVVKIGIGEITRAQRPESRVQRLTLASRAQEFRYVVVEFKFKHSNINK